MSTVYDELDEGPTGLLGQTGPIPGPAPPAASADRSAPDGPLFTAEDLISVYTRADMFADGGLVEPPAEDVAEAGFRIPFAFTRAAWLDTVAWSAEDTKRQKTPQDESGRLWDVLNLAKFALRALTARRVDAVVFEVYRVPRGGRARMPKKTRLKLHLGPGDENEPVITIMLPEED
ncbi:MAG TPA: DUF6573 family protein [Gemmataceae bacterium]|jgi:hypothetical protein|nr:DUF6573 family protein [Gemmataceae bacterium]